MLEQTGDLAVLHVTLGFLGHYYGQRNEVELAAQYLDRALALAAETDSYVFVPFLQAFRAEIEIKAGRHAEAMAIANRAVELGQQTRQQAGEAEAHRVLGWAIFHGLPDGRQQAEGELRQALEIDRRIGARVIEARTLFELADFLRQVGDEAQAATTSAEAASIAAECGLHWLPLPSPSPLSDSEPRKVDA